MQKNEDFNAKSKGPEEEITPMQLGFSLKTALVAGQNINLQAPLVIGQAHAIDVDASANERVVLEDICEPGGHKTELNIQAKTLDFFSTKDCVNKEVEIDDNVPKAIGKRDSKDGVVAKASKADVEPNVPKEDANLHDVKAPEADVKLDALKIDVDMNGPKLEVEEEVSKANLGKIGNLLENSCSDIGRLFSANAEAPNSELNVQASAVDRNDFKSYVGLDTNVQAPEGKNFAGLKLVRKLI